MEEKIAVPKKATEEMVKAGAEFALQADLSSDYPWPIYIGDLWGVMVANAPAQALSGICVETVDLEWRDASPLDREAEALGLRYRVAAISANIDAPWIAQVSTAANPYATTDLLSPGPLLEMEKACERDFASRISSCLKTRTVEEVRREYLEDLIALADRQSQKPGFVDGAEAAADWLRSLQQEGKSYRERVADQIKDGTAVLDETLDRDLQQEGKGDA